MTGDLSQPHHQGDAMSAIALTLGVPAFAGTTLLFASIAPS
jgi:hypothetical protein